MRLAGRSRTARAALALVVVSSAGLAAVAVSPAGTAASSGTVSVVLDEWKLVATPKTIRAGRVTFVVRNDGAMPHEFLVVRSDRAAGRLPVKGGKAVETGRRGKISQIRVGATGRLTLTLPKGKYVLLCNIVGHYQAGQFSGLRVR